MTEQQKRGLGKFAGLCAFGIVAGIGLCFIKWWAGVPFIAGGLFGFGCSVAILSIEESGGSCS